ncbi:MAG: polymer-forming cytoskeletal protein [Alphaproteobacteria bacterium]
MTMFRRRRDEDETNPAGTPEADELAQAVKPFARTSTPAPGPAAPGAPMGAALGRASPAVAPRAPEPARRASEPRPARAGENESKTLIVGHGICLNGEITACDKLVVEGRVEATLTSRIIEIADTGLFKGNAEIDEAEVRGRFEGDLIVRKRLFIGATGRVTGKVRYGQLEIECGGQISGEVRSSTDVEDDHARPSARGHDTSDLRFEPPASLHQAR